MSWTRRSWLATLLAAAVSSVTGFGRRHAAAAPARRPAKGPRPGEPGYKTRWIGHY